MKRRISLEKDFYNKEIDDLLYSQLLCLAEAAQDKLSYKLYLTKANCRKNQQLLYTVAALLDCKAQKKAYNRRMEDLKNSGLISEEDVIVNGKAVPAYTFPYKYEGRYYLIEKRMLEYVINTRNRFGVQIYVYLANAEKLAKYKGTDYIFTLRELVSALGFSSTTWAMNQKVKDILEDFRRSGLVNWEGYYDAGTLTPSPRMRLVNVVTEYSDLP